MGPLLRWIQRILLLPATEPTTPSIMATITYYPDRSSKGDRATPSSGKKESYMFKILPRHSWTTRKPRPMVKQDPKKVKEFFLHWPGNNRNKNLTPAQEQALLRSFLTLHMDKNGWSFIGYSFAVFSSGRCYKLRDMQWVPAAQEGHNTNTVGVCCIGPITSQMAATLIDLKNHCDRRAGRDLKVRGHGEVVQTECPGPDLRAFVPILNRKA